MFKSKQEILNLIGKTLINSAKKLILCRIQYVAEELKLVGWFYGISTLLGYLVPNPVYTYIKYDL